MKTIPKCKDCYVKIHPIEQTFKDLYKANLKLLKENQRVREKNKILTKENISLKIRLMDNPYRKNFCSVNFLKDLKKKNGMEYCEKCSSTFSSKVQLKDHFFKEHPTSFLKDSKVLYL